MHTDHMFEDIHEIAENSAYLKAVEEKDVSLEMLDQLPPYESAECKEIEDRLKAENKLDFNTIFHEPTGFYFIKCFLMADYAGDKAVFIKDVEAFRSMRFESARFKVAKLLYHRFVADDESHPFPVGSSVFELLRKRPEYKNEELSALRPSEMYHPLPVRTRIASAAVNEDDDDEDSSNKEERAKMDPPTNRDDALYEDDDDEELKDENGNPIPKYQPPSEKPKSSANLQFTDTPPDTPRQEEKSQKSQSKSGQEPNVPNVPDHPEPNGAVPSGSAPSSTASQSDSNVKPFKEDRDILHIGSTNAIGVYGKSVKIVKEKLTKGEAPRDLFDAVAEDVMNDLQHDVYPRFKQSIFYRKYIRTKAIELRAVTVKDFHTFRVLGRGGFGSVHACRKINSGALYAMKAINKKLVKVKQALQNVMEERDVLTMLDSKFVTNVKYALQDENTLYIIMDLMLGGDLKFHLINAGRFTEDRARFYAAEVLLGLEHIHSLNIIYRDMKLENVLLDENGHCRLSDLGLAVITKEKIRGYAGTPGYTAPEMIKNKMYGPSVDIFSYGVMLYRMLCGAKPFKGKVDRDLDKAVVEREPKFPPDIFSPEATDLLTGLLQKRPEKRLGCGPRGMEEIKDHPFFHSIDWGLLEAGYIDPPFVPNKFDVNAASLKDIGDFDTNKLRGVKLNERFKKTVKRFDHTNIKALQEEMVAVLMKADANVNFEKFQPQPIQEEVVPVAKPGCCSVC